MNTDKSKVLVLNLELLEVLGQGKVNEALVLQQIDYWCSINKNKNENYIDGKYWMFSSVKKMLERDFPLCFSLDTLKRTLNYLDEENFLITKKHKNGKLYRVNYKKISLKNNLKSDKNITKKEIKNTKTRLVQNAPTEEVKLVHFAPTQKSEVSAKCTNGYGKMHQPVSAKCTSELVQNAPTIKEINKENNIYIKYNNFIKNKELSNNSSVTDKANLLSETKQYNFWFDELKQDVELAKEQALNKYVGGYRINGEDVGIATIHEVLSEVNTEQINYCTDKILNTKQITNFENYVVACLYNAVLKNKNKNIKIFEKVKNENSLLGKYSWM